MFIFLGLPGVISIIAGMTTIKRQKVCVFGLGGPLQGWSKPSIAKGKGALFWGKLDIAIGLFFLFIFAMYLISVFCK